VDCEDERRNGREAQKSDIERRKGEDKENGAGGKEKTGPDQGRLLGHD
jgi:hypothetical protein